MAITLAGDGVEGAMATSAQPFIAQGPWLQIYLSVENSKQILADIDQVLNKCQHQQSSLPLTLAWHEMQLKMTVT